MTSLNDKSATKSKPNPVSLSSIAEKIQRSLRNCLGKKLIPPIQISRGRATIGSIQQAVARQSTAHGQSHMWLWIQILLQKLWLLQSYGTRRFNSIAKNGCTFERISLNWIRTSKFMVFRMLRNRQQLQHSMAYPHFSRLDYYL